MRTLAGIAMLALGCSGQALAADAVATASGQGQLYDGRTFAFTAEIFADGTADGMAVIKNSSFSGDSGKGPYKAKIEIRCARRDGNIITFGGMANKTNDSNLQDAAFFSVEDRGEPGKGVDQLSGLAFWDGDPTTTGDPMACLASPPFPMQTIESGNIQVKTHADPMAFKTAE
jgi:hypothetical protein